MPTLSLRFFHSFSTHSVLSLSKFFFPVHSQLDRHLFQLYHATPVCNRSPWISLNSLLMKSVPPSNLTCLPHFRHGFWTVPLRLFKPPAASTVMLNDPQPRRTTSLRLMQSLSTTCWATPKISKCYTSISPA